MLNLLMSALLIPYRQTRISAYLAGGDFNPPEPSQHILYILEEIMFQSHTAHPFGQNCSPKFCDRYLPSNIAETMPAPGRELGDPASK
jgi:hypothetical protein